MVTNVADVMSGEQRDSQAAPRIGVLALQGAFSLHARMLRSCGAQAQLVRTPADLADCDGLILPGGESTTIAKLLRTTGLYDPLQSAISQGLPVLGTCAGMILLATDIVDAGPNDLAPLGACPVSVRRNAFGRQVDSFEVPVKVKGLEGGEFPGVFIRAPWIDSWSPEVEVLAWHGEKTVLVQHANVTLCAFHPELTNDLRIHANFVRQCSDSVHSRQGVT